MKHIVIRTQRQENIAKAGKFFGGLLAFATAALVIREIPSLIRYARMEMM